VNIARPSAALATFDAVKRLAGGHRAGGLAEAAGKKQAFAIGIWQPGLEAPGAQETPALAEILLEHRQPRFPGRAWQAVALAVRGAPRDELEGIGRAAVITIGQHHVFRRERVVGPCLGCTAPRLRRRG